MHGGAAARRAAHAQLALERLDAVGEAAQARAARVVGSADAVVGDLDARRRPRSPEPDAGVRRARVLGDVGERLRGDEVDRQLDGLGQALGRLARHGRGDRRPARERAQRGGEAVLEHGGVDAARELAQLCHRLRELVARGRDELLRRRVVAEAVAEQPELQRDRDEPLLGTVVQVALQPPPLGVAGGDDPLARGLQLGELHMGLRMQVLVLDRDRRRRAGGLDQLRVLVERRVVDQGCDAAAVALHGGDGAPGAGARLGVGRREARAPGPGRRGRAAAPSAGRRHASCPDRGTRRRARRAPAASAAGRRGTPPARSRASRPRARAAPASGFRSRGR